MDNYHQPKWYFKTWPLVVAFFCVGPFMLPLVWANPRFSKKLKIAASTVIIILTYLLAIFFVRSLKSLSSYYQLILN